MKAKGYYGMIGATNCFFSLIYAFLSVTCPTGVHCKDHTYTKFHSGRHVCAVEKAVVEPMVVAIGPPRGSQARFLTLRRTDVYKAPGPATCQEGAPCVRSLSTAEGWARMRLRRNAYFPFTSSRHPKDTVRRETSYSCCPGWTQESKLSFGCNKDMDECVGKSPCDQICTNTMGSYRCHCQPGYHLQSDGRSCAMPKTNNGVNQDRLFSTGKPLRLKSTPFQRSESYDISTELSDNPSNSELLAMVETMQQKLDAMSAYNEQRWGKVETFLGDIKQLCTRIQLLEKRIKFGKRCLH